MQSSNPSIPMAQMTVLSTNNINTLAGICEKFFLEKYKAEITKEALNMFLPKILSRIVDHYNQHPPMPSVEEINKIAMMQVKSFVLQQISQSSRSSDINVNTNTNINANTTTNTNANIHAHEDYDEDEPLPTPQVQPLAPIQQQSQSMASFPQAESVDRAVKEDEFMKRLQSLEMQRNNGVILEQNQKLSLPTQPVPSTPIQSPIPLTPNNNNNMPPQPTIIYVPSSNPEKKATKHVITINGYDRQWEYFPDRSTFVWSGPAPTNTTSFALSCVMLPRLIGTLCSVIHICITGAGNHKCTIPCVMATQGTCWDKWIAIHPEIHALSCPWTIQLLDSSLNSIDFGQDNIIVRTVDTLLNNNIRITTDTSNLNKYIEIGHTLRMKYKNDTVTCRVLQISNNYIEIDANSQTQKIRKESILCNLTMQACVIIEALT
jgi:ribosomal 50S subunit-recycling heat shock protein